jgi:hypothetical protein
MLPIGNTSTMAAPARNAWNTSLGVVAPITQTMPSRRAAAATSGCRNGVAMNGIFAFLAWATDLASVTEPTPGSRARGHAARDVQRVRRCHRDLDGLQTTLHPSHGRPKGRLGIVRPDDPDDATGERLLQNYHRSVIMP